MRQEVLLGIVFALGVGTIAGLVFLSSGEQARVSETQAYSVPSKPGMTIPVAEQLSGELTSALLLVVYDAFGKTQEDEIYDTLAGVTHGDALEYLYLERVGAMAGGGLDEADQTIHEINLLDSTVSRDGAELVIDATWQVIGTVGHAEHLHVRGNTYSADLSVSPVEGAWRITDFTLRDVNRDTAGETFEISQEDHQ
ncbi:hypothetical protein [Ruegeria arenilitoris]|uniref:hypothetical protein n=1 Tax=Ruegeria arenilitoris TaxID=1173585 RepID=UPI00147D193C|nr:hypothetical protein [Ruegeria arenilitoris]